MKKIFFVLFLLSCTYSIVTAQADKIPAKKGDITITPIFHGALVLQWNNTTLFIDPYGGAERFTSFPSPDLVLITHLHGDHLNKETLSGLDLTDTKLIAPQSVADELGEITFMEVHILKNGEDLKWRSLKVRAVPMYNLPETDDSRHPKGWGNGYVITLGKKQIYISGDTEDIPEMRRLEDIDVAFVCMNLPFTMTVEQASDAVLDFQPAIVYPFHFRGREGFSDVNQFKEIVNKGNADIEVRLREWYTEMPGPDK